MEFTSDSNPFRLATGKTCVQWKLDNRDTGTYWQRKLKEVEKNEANTAETETLSLFNLLAV